MAHTFVVSDESINSYGFRVLTHGIDQSQFKRNPIMLYMHRRNTHNPTGDEIIGRWENIRIENGKLLADAVFDENNEFAKKIAEKVKNGFIKMASIGILKVEISTEKEHLKKGQTRPTVTKSLLTEISIVDMGGNNNALKLYNNQGEELTLEKLNFKNENDMSNLTSIALALGMDAESCETEVLQAVTTLKTKKDNAETKLAAFEKAQKEKEEKEATALVHKASLSLGLQDAAKTSFENTYLALFGVDHQNTKTAIEGMLSNTGKANTANKNQAGVHHFMKDVHGSSQKDTATTTKSFDFLQKHDTTELKRIKDQEPEVYETLVADYAKGVRHI